MSTETTNKKIKIDNGTTFGRTYTDKAVDELLKNVGGSGTSVIELTDKNGTIASAQLGKINANPQNFAFKYSGKILLFTTASSTTYQYCNNTTNSSDNNVMTTSTLLTIESSTGVYTIAENVHNVVANSIHPVNGGDLTNIQVGSKVYSIPSGGGKSVPPTLNLFSFDNGNSVVRTTITEEEKTNLENGLYNQVIYATGDNFLPMCSPSKIFNANGGRYFAQFKMLVNADGTFSYSSVVVNSITIGEKNASNEYPITIQEAYEIPFRGGDGSSSFNIVQINDFHAGDHNQQGFVMPTENMVLFTNGSNTSLIGYKNVQNNVTSYVCYEWRTVSESGRRHYKYIGYTITEITTGYNIKEVDLSEALQTDFEFLPHYSSSDNGKILSVINGKTQWATPTDSLELPSKPPTSQLIPSITTSNMQQNLTIGNGLEIRNGALQEKVLNVSITLTEAELSQSINSGDASVAYIETDKSTIFDFIKAQNGIMKLTINTPIGTLYMTLRPSLWKDDANHSYNFEGTLYLEIDLSTIGGTSFNQVIVRAICWDTDNSVAFRPTIIPIGTK